MAKEEIKREVYMYMLQMMNMCRETAIMMVLKIGLYSIHEGEKRVQNLDIDILH